MAEDKVIKWEDYRSNYIDNNSIDEDIDELDEDMDIDDDYEDDNDNSEAQNINKIMSMVAIPFGPNMHNGKMINTPWGGFGENNKLAPFNFYELKIAHFKGFSTLTIPDFTSIMDSVDGVAVWKSLDPYCIIVGKARIYTWEEVSANVKAALIGSSSGPPNPAVEKLNKLTQFNKEIKEVIDNNRENNITQYTAAIFPNGKVIQVMPTEDGYEDKLKQIEELKSKLSLIIIENGVVKC